ncbi:hypothetical protein F52700_909 [Fusarium sp. NRRL 52700]|nr:hypothetical protein F52700_909 [Fusarium sp. NRRL 52700]
MKPMSKLPNSTSLHPTVTIVNDPDSLTQRLKTSEVHLSHLNLIMTPASVDKPKSGAVVDILKTARQIQHLAYFLSQGPVPGLALSDSDLKAARALSPVTNITSHRRHSELEFPREWVEDDGALAIALRQWRRDIDPKALSPAPSVEEKPAQTTDTPTETDIEAYADMPFFSYSAQREAHWVKKTQELERKLRLAEQEKGSILRDNIKLQRDVEVLQRMSQSFHRALFDPDRRIHETNMRAKVKLNAEIRQLKRSLNESNTKNESLVEKNKELQSSNKTLVIENEELVKKTEKLELSNFDLVTENVSLDAEIKDLDSDNQDLLTMVQKFLDKYALSTEATKKYEETLIASSQALKSENEALVMELADLKTDNQRCAAQAKELRMLVNDYESSKDFLTAQNNDLSTRNVALGDKNKRLEGGLGRIVADAKRLLESVD